MKQMEGEWFCFIEEANFHIIGKLNYQIVTSCPGIARSYFIAAVSVDNEPVQNTQWYR